MIQQSKEFQNLKVGDNLLVHLEWAVVDAIEDGSVFVMNRDAEVFEITENDVDSYDHY